MAVRLSEFLAEHPVDCDAVEAHKAQMLADIDELRDPQARRERADLARG
ncbi:hypothetical protein NMP99_07630 [Glutamicibacter mishrai]|nr:hypothetical protein [Glutamicibacter mishrai]UTT41125.1 hypothetical protein NMP99_07630 [Glutamicibacter mishrai]